ncbi:MFS transporter [Streptomyces sp. CB02460]|uniref:MFS transporter n=1 Tax=Streptomyces sp. CB02460 TaxID=1703941 RepID=UPI001F5B93A3|nr:MFS transporter [Streptomyces sp. CB02460]
MGRVREQAGLLGQLRNPPGGRDARIMLRALAVDRTGTGLWAASSVLYLTFVTHLSAQQIGVLLGTAGVAGIAGSPLAGRLATRFPVRPLLIGCHLLRLVTLTLVLLCARFEALLVVVAVTYLGDRAAKTLEMLFATRAAGERRAAYQALSRSAANAGYGLGAGLAAIGLAAGTADAYRALILGNALSFLVAAALVWRTGEPGGRVAGPKPAEAARPRTKGPWRDRGYLRFVLLDIPMNLDDSVLGVGLPLWLVTRTSAPHALVPAFLVINTVLVVLLQLAVSRRAEGPRKAVRAVLLYGVLLFVTCALLAASTACGTWTAAGVLLAAAVLVTMAELMRSVSSWELAVLLAPPDERAAYLGVAGMSQSIQKSAGPPLLTGVVMAVGPAGWLALGVAVAGLAVWQRRCCEGRLAEMEAPGPVAQPARQ